MFESARETSQFVEYLTLKILPNDNDLILYKVKNMWSDEDETLESLRADERMGYKDVKLVFILVTDRAKGEFEFVEVQLIQKWT